MDRMSRSTNSMPALSYSWRGAQVALQHLEVHIGFAALLEHLEAVQQQGAAQPLALGTGVDGQVLDKGAGPALRHRENTAAVTGHQAQRRVVLGIGDELPAPLLQVADTAAALVLGHAQHGMDRRGQFIAIMIQPGIRWPLRGGQAASEVATQELVILGQGLQALLRHGLRGDDQALGQLWG